MSGAMDERQETKQERAQRLFKRSFGRKLSAAREGAKMSRRELADATGITEGMIAHYECGRRLPGVFALCRICKVLGRDSSFLLGL